MESPTSKSDNINNFCNHMIPPEAHSRYLPFLEAGFWPGTTSLPPFLMAPVNREGPHFWPVPWLPHLWPSPTQNSKNGSTRSMISTSSTASPSPDASSITNGPIAGAENSNPTFRPSLNDSPTNNPQSLNLNVHRPRSGTIVDPILALASMEGKTFTLHNIRLEKA